MSEPRPRVLVTGGGGYIASWCVAELLRQGYDVVATTRSSAKHAAIRTGIASAGPEVAAHLDRLSFALADLTADAGWDDAMAGCAYVLHVASPLRADEADPVTPARDGTRRVIQAAIRAGVKRVVMTSAAATARVPKSSTAVADETVWSDPDDPRFDPYRRSKILAERAAWEVIEGAATELVTILPGAVLGPGLVAGDLTSLSIVHRMLTGKMPGLARLALWVVDVRDLAALHVRALTEPAAANQRFLATGEMMWMSDVADTLRARLGDKASKVTTRKLPDFVVKGMAAMIPELRALTPELGRRNDVTSDKARRLLGFAPRPAADTIVDSGNYCWVSSSGAE